MYLRDVQSQVNKYFGDGQRTHLVDVTSPGSHLYRAQASLEMFC